MAAIQGVLLVRLSLPCPNFGDAVSQQQSRARTPQNRQPKSEQVQEDACRLHEETDACLVLTRLRPRACLGPDSLCGWDTSLPSLLYPLILILILILILTGLPSSRLIATLISMSSLTAAAAPSPEAASTVMAAVFAYPQDASERRTRIWYALVFILAKSCALALTFVPPRDDLSHILLALSVGNLVLSFSMDACARRESKRWSGETGSETAFLHCFLETLLGTWLAHKLCDKASRAWQRASLPLLLCGCFRLALLEIPTANLDKCSFPRQQALCREMVKSSSQKKNRQIKAPPLASSVRLTKSIPVPFLHVKLM